MLIQPYFRLLASPWCLYSTDKGSTVLQFQIFLSLLNETYTVESVRSLAKKKNHAMLTNHTYIILLSVKIS